MCQFKSGVVFKNRVVLASRENESHSALLESLGVEDTRENALTKFVRVELIPKDDNKTTDVSEWKYIVDQDDTPQWYDEDTERYEQEFRDAVKEWWEGKFEEICGHPWTVMKEDELGTYYVLDGITESGEFGETNNYEISDTRKRLNESKLVKDLMEKFGDRLVPITLDLTSLDGLTDYGVVEGDLIAPLTFDLYRDNRRYGGIPKLDKGYFLATPDSTPSGYGSRYVLYVYSNGNVFYGNCDSSRGVRPFFILKS